jgi:hypothetical protein
LARLYLHCVICSRKQADGLLSGAAWGKLELPHVIDHPAVRGTTARACPTCIGQHRDWEQLALTSLGIATAGFASSR